MATDGTFLCRLLEARVEVVFLTVDLAMDIIEGLSPQRPATGTADEAVGVVQVAHGLACLACTCHFVPTRVTYTCYERKIALHFG